MNLDTYLYLLLCGTAIGHMLLLWTRSKGGYTYLALEEAMGVFVNTPFGRHVPSVIAYVALMALILPSIGWFWADLGTGWTSYVPTLTFVLEVIFIASLSKVYYIPALRGSRSQVPLV